MKASVLQSAFLIALAASSIGHAANVTVTVKNVANNSGVVRAAICDKNNFLKVCNYKASEKSAREYVVLTFKDVPAGHYALNAYHDENDNNRMDRNLFGMPSEGYAFSRDAKGRSGPPQFEDAAFDVSDDGNDLSVTLNY
jgi:uncharacterized protein (DUF2141 family)